MRILSATSNKFFKRPPSDFVVPVLADKFIASGDKWMAPGDGQDDKTKVAGHKTLGRKILA